MADFVLPKNSRIRKGKEWPAPEGATRTKAFHVYRWDPDTVPWGRDALPNHDRFGWNEVATEAKRSRGLIHELR